MPEHTEAERRRAQTRQEYIDKYGPKLTPVPQASSVPTPTETAEERRDRYIDKYGRKTTPTATPTPVATQVAATPPDVTPAPPTPQPPRVEEGPSSLEFPAPLSLAGAILSSGRRDAEASALAGRLLRGPKERAVLDIQQTLGVPAAAALVLWVEQQAFAGEQALEKETKRLRAEGAGPLDAVTRAYNTPGVVPIWAKIPAEMVTDPLNPILGPLGPIARAPLAGAKIAGRQAITQATRRQLPSLERFATTPGWSSSRSRRTLQPDILQAAQQPSPTAAPAAPAAARAADVLTAAPTTPATPTTPAVPVGGVPTQAVSRRGPLGRLGGLATARLGRRRPPPRPVIPQLTIAPEEVAVNRLTSLIESAVPVREATEALKSAELGRRVAVGARMLEKTADPREAFRRARGALAGELPTVRFTPPEPGMAPDQITSLFEQIRSSDLRHLTKTSTDVALNKVLAGELPTRSEIVLLEEMFGAPLAKSILKQRPGGRKAFESFMDIANIPRSLVTAFDASAPLRQGVVLAAGHPKRFTQNVVVMFKAMARESYAVAIDDAIKADPLYSVLVQRGPQNKKGLFIAERTAVTGGLAAREEAFMSRLAQRIPGIRISERAYVTFLNKLRFDVAKDTYNGWLRAGKTITDADIDELVLFLNRATGRGGLGPAEDLAPMLNAAFFSPRLLSSRFTLPASLFTTNKAESAGVIWLTQNVGVRKMVAKDLAAFVGTGIGILSLIKLSGVADVGVDPRSSEFGKIRIGPTRIEFWGGFQPIVRLVAQLITNERLGTGTESITGLNRTETVARFVRSKLGPPGAFGTDIALGTTFLGERLTLSQRTVIRQVYERFTPFFIQDVVDAINEQGLTGGLLAIPGGLGAGITSFDTVEDAAQKEFGVSFVDLWPFEQRDARNIWKVSRDEFFVEGLEREREPTRSQELETQRMAQLEETAEDTTLTKQEKINRYFGITAEFAVRQDESGRTIFGDSDYEPVIGGTPDQQQALQEYYDSIVQATSPPPASLFDNRKWQPLLNALEVKWKRQGILEYVQANTRTKGVPQQLRDILPQKTRDRLDAGDRARQNQRRKRRAKPYRRTSTPSAPTITSTPSPTVAPLPKNMTLEQFLRYAEENFPPR